MFNPGWEEALTAASLDLAPGGAIAVVDFHDSGSTLFKRWMGLHHVRLDGHLLPGLQKPLSQPRKPPSGRLSAGCGTISASSAEKLDFGGEPGT